MTFRVQVLEHFINIGGHVIAVTTPVIAGIVIIEADKQTFAELF